MSVHCPLGSLCPGGGLCPGGLCQGGSLSRESPSKGGLCPVGSLSRGSLFGGFFPGGLCPGGSLSRGISVQGGLCHGYTPVTVICGWYASYWNAFLFVECSSGFGGNASNGSFLLLKIYTLHHASRLYITLINLLCMPIPLSNIMKFMISSYLSGKFCQICQKLFLFLYLVCLDLDVYFYLPQGKVTFSEACVCHSVHGAGCLLS